MYTIGICDDDIIWMPDRKIFARICQPGIVGIRYYYFPKWG